MKFLNFMLKMLKNNELCFTMLNLTHTHSSFTIDGAFRLRNAGTEIHAKYELQFPNHEGKLTSIAMCAQLVSRVVALQITPSYRHIVGRK